ncbi:MAG: diguanylate cyclase [Planctomycetota bacterium]
MTATPETSEQRPTLLVVDDSADVHRLLHARLRREELDLISAHTGEEGLSKARENQPGLVLLDLDMPGMDGFEVLREFKDDQETVHIPVIVLSALSQSIDKVTAFDLGAVDYITKPFDVTELRVRIRSALKVHRLLRMLAEKAHIDGLTGLFNRQAFDESWAKATSANARHATPLSLAMFDLDHFKSLNDTFGHPAGDDAIRVFARTLSRESREADIACRYGGEEFVLIMPETAPEDANSVCERVGAQLRSLSWPSHPERSVTVSIGVAGTAQQAAIRPADWVAAADRALYAAKAGGRDRTEVIDLAARQIRMAKAG